MEETTAPGGTLAGFRAWCEGDTRDGTTPGRHYAAINALDRYDMFLANCKLHEQELLLKRQRGE